METTTMPNEAMLGTALPQESAPAMPTVSDVIGEGTPAAVQEGAVTQDGSRPEPGYLASKRAKWQAEWESQHSQEMAKLRGELDTMREYVINDQADKLVASGKVTDRELALELVRNRNGVSVKPEGTNTPTERPRDAQGRFVSTSPNNTPEIPNSIQVRANELFEQARTLQKFSGVDVLSVYRSNPEYVERVNSGEWDMTDVLTAFNQSGQRNVPTPVRNAHTGGISPVNFRSMSSEQFEKLNKALETGGKYSIK